MLQLYVTLQMLKSGAVDRVRSVGRNEDGGIAIEYAIIAVVIALALVAAAGFAFESIEEMLERIVPWD